MAQWFERLLNRLEQGLAMPFLGAGMSAEARLARAVPAPEDHSPGVSWLNQRLVELLLPDLGDATRRTRLAHSVFVDAWLHCWTKTPVEQRAASTRRATRGVTKPPRTLRRALLCSAPRLNELALHALACRATKGTPDVRRCAVVSLESAARKRLDHLAEAAIERFGARKVCEALRIELYTYLEPTPAHVSLAYLAREGLITDVLTTNYDTCIEKAFELSFHPDERQGAARRRYSEDPPVSSGTANRGTGAEPEELQVITGIEQYRERGGQRRTRGGPRGSRPILRLYKLNGCAFEYRQRLREVAEQERRDSKEREEAKGRAERAAESIVLTERQLQSFGGRSWARDLFRDRARTQSFVFVGFGSEEPQIRHTALEVMNEWGNGGPRPCWDLPNAPFMSVYDRELSFTQAQLMRGYRDAHQCGGCQAKSDPLCAGRELQHCFTGHHAEWFGRDSHLDEQPSPASAPRAGRATKLSADRFWQRLFQASYARQAVHQCAAGTPFARWVEECTDGKHHLYLLEGMLDWYWTDRKRWEKPMAQASGGNDAQASELPPFPWAIRFGLLDEDKAPHEERDAREPMRPLRLSIWLMSVEGSLERCELADKSGSRCPSGHPYYPLREDPLLVLGTLLLVYMLQGDSSDPGDSKVQRAPTGVERRPEKSPKPGRFGLSVPLVSSGPEEVVGNAHVPAARVWLVSNEWAEANTWAESNEVHDGGGLVRQLVIPTLRALPAGSRLRRVRGDVVRVGRCVRLAAESYVHAASTGLGIPLGSGALLGAALGGSRVRDYRAAGRNAELGPIPEVGRGPAQLLRAFAEAEPRRTRARLVPFRPRDAESTQERSGADG